MDVRAEGPHRVGSLLFVTAAGTYAHAIVAKATFVLAPEASPLVLDGGDPLFVEDLRWQDDPQYSLRAASDLVPFKRSPEVLVTGSAYAPGGKPVKVSRVRVAIGTLDKTVEVQGDRCFGPDGSLSEPAPWTRMPLVWERAAGGPGTSNPVGVLTGPDSYPDAWGRVFLPNLAAPWTMVSHLGETLSPAGFSLTNSLSRRSWISLRLFVATVERAWT